MSAETRSRVGRHEPTSMSADTRPILHCHSAATRPPLGRYFTNTRPTLSSLGQLLLPPEFYLPCSTGRGFQWPSSFFGLCLCKMELTGLHDSLACVIAFFIVVHSLALTSKSLSERTLLYEISGGFLMVVVLLNAIFS